MITLQQRSRRLSADLETPISLFLSLTQNKIPGLLLESAEVDGRWGRYSIIACDYLMTVSCVDAKLSLSIKDDRLASLKELEGMPYLDGLRSLMQRLELVGDDMRQAPITRALYGYFGYETAALFQPRLAQAIPASSAESCLVLAGTVIVFDHLYNRLTQLSLGEHRDLSHAPLHGAEEPSVGEVSRTPDQAAYMKGVEHIKELLHDGEAIQVVLSSQASAEFHGDAFMLYRRMRSINPSPYMFFMRLPEVTLFGSSPELMVRCTDGKLQLSPIAGTRRRGRDDEEDAALAAELLDDVDHVGKELVAVGAGVHTVGQEGEDPKECSEHVMLVDLGRNDLGRVAKPGSVKLERLMEIERFSHVMHMTSRVTAQVNDGLDVLDILGAAFPAGTVSGAPKVRAMEILAEEEPLPRGPYAGCIGWLGLDKNGVHMDSGITIRSMWVKDGRIHWQTGAGIVYDSDPAAEWQECMNKGKIIDVILKGEDHVSVH